MRIERRPHKRADGTTAIGAVLIAEHETESALIDELFGCTSIGPDGLIARRTVEVRLADGFREHYIFVIPEQPATVDGPFVVRDAAGAITSIEDRPSIPADMALQPPE